MSPSIRRRERVTHAVPIPPCWPSEAAAISDSLRFAQVPIDDLRAPPRNIRRYTKRQSQALIASLKEFGMVRPVLASTDGTLIAGFAVWQAARELGLTSIPVVYVEHLSPEQIRLYRIADNKLATLGKFDEEALRLEFLELDDLSLKLDLRLDLEVTGFNTREIDDITLKEPPSSGEPEVKIEVPKVAVSRPGDIWRVGNHKIICGNSLEKQTYHSLLGAERAQMVVCDGPFNVAVKGHVSGRADAREFAFASGEMSSEEFTAFQRTIFRHLVAFSVDGSIHYQFMDWRSLYELLAAGRAEYTEIKNVLVWVKTNAARGFYRSQHEFCAVFKNGREPHICTFGLEEGARYRSNVLMGYPGCNSFGAHRDTDLADHPTVKNLSLIADLIRDCSRRGGLILDAFGGSGTTLLAAELTGRRARLIEIDPLYVDVTIRRANERFGLASVLESTGQSFSEVAMDRLGYIPGKSTDNDPGDHGGRDADDLDAGNELIEDDEASDD